MIEPTGHNSVRQQFNRQVGHYLSDSAMADRAVIDAILQLAPVAPGSRVLDVACGAGFLLRAYTEAGARAVGVDISEAMLREAAATLAPCSPWVPLAQCDATRLPFSAGVFQMVVCKLAFHYFRQPHEVLAEMTRVCEPGGRVVLIDRVADEDPAARTAQNELEKQRTPNKVCVYTISELLALMLDAGLAVCARRVLCQPMDFAEWMAAAGASHLIESARQALLEPHTPLAKSFEPHGEGGRLRIKHRTAIVVATTPNLVA